MIDVNFLPGKNILTLKERRLRGIFVLVAIVFTLICVLVNGSLFFFRAKLLSDVKALEDKKTALVIQVGSYHDLASTLRVLERKAEGIKTILAQQSDFSLEISNIRAVFGSSGEIKTILVANNGTALMTVFVPDYPSLSTALRNLASDDAAMFLHNVRVSELRSDARGGFIFSINLTYNSGKGGSLVSVGPAVRYRDAGGNFLENTPGVNNQ